MPVYKIHIFEGVYHIRTHRPSGKFNVYHIGTHRTQRVKTKIDRALQIVSMETWKEQ